VELAIVTRENGEADTTKSSDKKDDPWTMELQH